MFFLSITERLRLKQPRIFFFKLFYKEKMEGNFSKICQLFASCPFKSSPRKILTPVVVALEAVVVVALVAVVVVVVHEAGVKPLTTPQLTRLWYLLSYLIAELLPHTLSTT